MPREPRHDLNKHPPASPAFSPSTTVRDAQSPRARRPSSKLIRAETSTNRTWRHASRTGECSWPHWSRDQGEASRLSPYLIHTVGGILISGIVLTLVFGLLGTLFGYAGTHWLTGRLRLVADGVDAWGRGDLEVVARDVSDDEIGQSVRDLQDAVKQQVFATAMQLEAAQAVLETDPSAARELLFAAERLVSQAQGERIPLIADCTQAAVFAWR